MTPSGTDFQRPTLKPHLGARLRYLVRRWPALVWLLLVMVTIIFYLRSMRFVGIAGVVEASTEMVTPLEVAKLAKVSVKIGEMVEPGQVVAQMDTTMINAKLSLAESRMMEEMASVDSYKSTVFSLLRSADSTVRDSEAKLESARQLLNAETARLNELKIEQARRDKLYEAKLMAATDVNILKPEIAALTKNVTESYPEQILLSERHLKEAYAARDELRRSMGITEDDENMIEAVIDRETQIRLDLMKKTVDYTKLAVDAYTLRASMSGMVSLVYFSPGEAVPAGEPVLKIVGGESDTVLGFLNEVHLGSLGIGAPVYVHREANRGGITAVGTVESISPEIDTMPGRLSSLQGQIIRGRRVQIALKPQYHGYFLPGETVSVRAASPLWIRIQSYLAGE